MRKIIALIFVLSVPAYAESNIKQEIIDRCKTQMEEYGAALIKVCVDNDIAAANNLVDLKKDHEKIVIRCLTSMRSYGYSLVEVCVKQDIEAEEALSNY